MPQLTFAASNVAAMQSIAERNGAGSGVVGSLPSSLSGYSAYVVNPDVLIDDQFATTPLYGVRNDGSLVEIATLERQGTSHLSLNGNPATLGGDIVDNQTAFVFQTAGSSLIFSNTPLSSGQSVTFTAAQNDYVAAVCFVSGTRILTRQGDIAVEDLQVGDLAVTASGTVRPITWIGHRAMTAAGAALPFHQQPVRVRAGAFGHGLPVRDLYLSPGHPVLIGADEDNEGGVLVPIMCLINGTTITREPLASVTYWHVELDAHDILLAEGLPAESYIDGGDRAFFVEGSDHALHNPDFIPPGWHGRCRPVAVDGPLVEAERLRLDAVFAGSLSEHCAWDAASAWAA